MLPWMRRWRDWAMRELWPVHRIGPQAQAVRHGYEKAGLTLYDQPVPWNAEAVLVEARLRLPPPLARRKADFQFRLPGAAPVMAESLRRPPGEEAHRLVFRLPMPARTVTGELFNRQRPVAALTIPVVGRDEFLQGVRLEMASLFARLGGQSVACQAFVSSQCRGLLASAVLTSPTSLVPVVELGLRVELRPEEGGPVQTVAAQLTTSQLAERRTLVTVVPGRLPRRAGTWLVTWVLADRPLLTQQVRAVSPRHFRRSLRVADSRFLVEQSKGRAKVCRQLPPLDEVVRAGPCFLVTSLEPGMAGLAHFEVHAQVAGTVRPPEVFDQQVLITDGPTIVAPGTLDAPDLAQVTGFELRLKGESLGVASTSPIPAAAFTGEGGFRPAPEFGWTHAAEEELAERLNRLLDERGGK